MFPRAVLIVALLALLGCNWQPYSRSTSGVSARDKQVLYDFRDTSSPLPPKLDKATQTRVLTTVSPNDKIYDNLLGCGHDEQGVVLHISSVAAGSFTTPDAKETAYLVGVYKCGQTMAEMGSTNRLVVFNGNQLVASAETRFNIILKTYDLNGDGLNELLLAGGWTHGGEITTQAALVRFEKRGLVTTENFGTVYHDACDYVASLSDEQRKDRIAKGIEPIAEALAVSYLPRPGQQMPSFVAERYRAPCPANANQKPNWQRVGN